MLTKKEQKLMIKLKYNAYTLHKNYQIPDYLYLCIVRLNNNDDINYIKLLMFLSEQLLRIKYFYKKYGDVHKDMNEFIKNQVNDYTKSNLNKGC